MGPTQLAKEHADELTPTAKPTAVSFGLVLLDDRFKLQTGKQLEQLTENAAYSIQGAIPPGGLFVLAELQSH